jgi:hypothetical protein
MKLIETLAVDLARMIIGEFGAKTVTVEVKKFVISQARHVSVSVTRSQEEFRRKVPQPSPTNSWRMDFSRDSLRP